MGENAFEHFAAVLQALAFQRALTAGGQSLPEWLIAKGVMLQGAGLQDDIAVSSPAAEGAEGGAPLAPLQRAALLERLPHDTSPPARAAVACLTGSDAQVPQSATFCL